MAVNDTSDQNNNQGQPARDPAHGPSTLGQAFEKAGVRPNPGAARTDRGRASFSFSNLNRLSNAPMGRNPASEVLTKTQKALAQVFEGINNLYEITLIPIDQAQTSRLNIAVLVVCARETQNKDIGVGYHTLILEGSVESIPSRFENINGQNIEIIRTASDYNDAVMGEVVAEAVSRHFPQAVIYNADATVVPRDFNLADEHAVYVLAANAAFATTYEIEQQRSDFVDMNLANASRDEALTVRTAFPRTTVLNGVGQPVRDDITIDLTAAPTNLPAGQQSIEAATLVTRVSAFMDLVWDPVAPPQNAYAPYTQPQANQFQRYAARLVMTSMENQKLLTLPGQLLALVTALSLRENNAWVQAFRPQPYSGNSLDLHDIGAVGIDANFDNNPTGFGTRIDTKSDSFKPEQNLGKLVASVVKPGLILSLDVAEAGPDSWYNGVFAAAAEGNPRANEAVIEAANYLTDGNFARHFPANGRVAIDENNRIHMGYYTDAQGIRRDLRDIDYLAVLNLLGEKDPEVARDWSDTFNRVQYPLAQRLAVRKRIIQGIFSDVVFTGFARRVSFEAAFIDALAAGCQECGLDVRAVTPYADQGSYERATATFAQSAMLNPNATGLFNRGFGAAQGGYAMGANRAFGGRWS